MRIAFLANEYLHPDNARSWSGLPYYMKQGLEAAGLDIVTLQPKETRLMQPWVRFLYWRWLRGKRYLRYCNLRLLKSYGWQFQRELGAVAVDAIISPSTWFLAYLQTKLPVFLWTDACFAGMVNFYGSFSNMAPPSIRLGHAIEWRALHRCTRAIYSSLWAADLARQCYDMEPEKICIIPFGGNLKNPPTLEEATGFVQRRALNECNLLFIGVDWDRKGADIAVETFEALLRAGVAARLTVVGCTPPRDRRLPAGVEVIPFIVKETAEGRRRLHGIFQRSHFFIMPSRAEAFGLVFPEANAFGVPCLAANVGGISSIITNGVNGQLFPREAGGAQYADYILQTMSNPARYRELGVRSAQEAVTRFSWEVAGRRVARLIGEVSASDDFAAADADGEGEGVCQRQ